MKAGDFIGIFIFASAAVFLSIGETRLVYMELTAKFPYVMGFLKFAVLASFGELLGIRILERRWRKPLGFVMKVLIWGCIGTAVTFMFRFYYSGVISLQGNSVLPFKDIMIGTAFFTSLLMNLTFGPAFMIAHRFTDNLIEYYMENKSIANMDRIISRIDWKGFFTFIFKTILFFWIPAHTLVFLLPDNFRVLSAAFLSIFLGVLLSLAGKKGAIKRKALL